jgi:dihydroorotase
VFITPNTNPAISTKSIVEFVQRKAAGHIVNLRPLGAVSKDIEGKNLSEMLDMHQHGAIAFTDGWKPVQNANLMLKALEYVKAFDGIILQLPVEETLSAGGLMNEGPESTRLGMPGIPQMAETLLLHRDIELLRYTGSRLHVTGISTATSVDMIRKAKAAALNITCSVTPYHLTLTDEKLAGYSSMYKVTPPLRSEADRLALIEGLNDGTIDCIASHHRPQEWDAKTKEFEYAADGMNLQEITFPVLWQTLHKDVTIETLVTALATSPRQIFGLKEPSIDEGSNAELTIFTTKGKQAVKQGALISASANNPFIGQDLIGKVLATISNQQVFINK